uniref:RNA polymerase Rpb1 domain-containing protein n=1 Tax=viral metagenome TaxID=1070528 RepID=A0A6C0JYA3_9ZZZZ
MADWTTLPGLRGVDYLDKPRRLTDEELIYVTEQMPVPQSHDKYVNQYRYENIVEETRRQLSFVELAPSMIDELRIRISNICYRSIEPPGASGTTSISAVVSRVTQEALSGFHHSGSVKTSAISTGVLTSIFNANTARKDRNMTVHFLNKTMDRREVFDIIRTWITVKVGHMITKHIVYSLSSGKRDDLPWWSFRNKPYWAVYYPTYADDKRTPAEMGILRLYLNVKKMLMFGVTLDALVSALSSNSTYTFFGSIQDGFIEIATKDHIKKTFRGNIAPARSEMDYLLSYVLEGIKDQVISGYFKKTDKDDHAEYVTDVEVMTEHISKLVDVKKGAKSNTWTLTTDSEYVSIDDILTIMRKAKLLTKSQVRKAEFLSDFQVEVTSDSDLRKKVVKAPSDVGYAYAMTYGSAFESVMCEDYIDPSLTVTNDVRGIYRVLGIEATRKFLTETLRGIVDAKLHFGEHADLVIDAVTRTGVPKPIGPNSLNDSVGVISIATARAAGDKLIRSSMTLSEESTDNIIPGILTGTMMRIGTHKNAMVQVSVDGKHEIEVEGVKYRVKIKDEIYRVPRRSRDTGVLDISSVIEGVESEKIEEASLNYDVVKKVSIRDKTKEVSFDVKSPAFAPPPRINNWLGKIPRNLRVK